MRPKKTRWIKCLPGERCFQPKCKKSPKLEGVILTIDEFEAIRLVDFEDLEHLEAAKKMRVSRPTLSRILSSAHKKIADAFVNIKAIKIEGGCCKIKRRAK